MGTPRYRRSTAGGSRAERDGESPGLGIRRRISSDLRIKIFGLLSVLAFAALAAFGDDGATGGALARPEEAAQAPVVEAI